jgi:hypothetical protein
MPSSEELALNSVYRALTLTRPRPLSLSQVRSHSSVWADDNAVAISLSSDARFYCDGTHVNLFHDGPTAPGSAAQAKPAERAASVSEPGGLIKALAAHLRKLPEGSPPVSLADLSRIYPPAAKMRGVQQVLQAQPAFRLIPRPGGCYVELRHLVQHPKLSPALQQPLLCQRLQK